MNRKAWTDSELAVLRKLYPVRATHAIARILARPITSVYNRASADGLRKGAAFYESAESGILRKGETRAESIPHQFCKGHVPANKGLRRPGWAPGRMAETQFRKGNRTGKAALNWRPIGTVLKDAEGYLRIKVREAVPGVEPTGFGNTRCWPLLARHVWEQNKGPIPPGHVIAFVDRDKGHCEIENLECISRGELAHRNRMWGRYPDDLARAIQLNGALKRKLREANGKEQNAGPARPSLRDAGGAEGPGKADGPGAREDDQRGRPDTHQFRKGGGRSVEGDRLPRG